MKTLKEWENSSLNLDEYLCHPCEIDEELYNDILECVPPSYLGELAQQSGEAHDSFENHKGKEIFTYTTVSNVNGRFFYLGILPKFKG